VPQVRTSASPLTLLTLGHFFSDFYSNFLPALLPVLLAHMGLSLAAGGFLVMVYSFTSCILQPLSGYYIDKRGYTWLILITLPVSALTICFSTFAPSYAVLVAFIAFAGLGSSVFHPLASSLVKKVTRPERKVFAMSVFIGGGNMPGLSYGLGGMGVAITGALADHVGLATALLWSLMPVAAAIPLTLAIPAAGPRPLPPPGAAAG
jgi:MFS family permease